MVARAIITSGLTVAMLGVSSGALAFDRTTAPVSGTYEAELYIQSASSGCLDKAGFAFVGEMSFPNLSGSTWALRALESGSNYLVDSIQVLSIKTGKGTTKLTGDLTWTGAGVGDSWSKTGTFSATVTEVDGHDFVVQLDEAYTGCSAEDINVELTRVGAEQ